jgi:hypothetical protein
MGFQKAKMVIMGMIDRLKGTMRMKKKVREPDVVSRK